jgi:hypothetical protein
MYNVYAGRRYSDPADARGRTGATRHRASGCVAALMSPASMLLLLLLLLLLSWSPALVASADGAAPAAALDWAAFLARADLVYRWNTTTSSYPFLPVDWWNSAFLGNGNLGMQVVAGVHDSNRLATSPPSPPPPAERCCCCWNRVTQPCNSSAQCDTGGEGCVAKFTPTKRYGPAACLCDGKSHGCPPAPRPPSSPPPPPLPQQPALRFEVGRLDVTDDRQPGSAHYTGNLKCDRPRLAIGYIYLRAKGEVESAQMRLGLWNAELSANVTTSKGSLNVSVLTHGAKTCSRFNVLFSNVTICQGRLGTVKRTLGNKALFPQPLPTSISFASLALAVRLAVAARASSGTPSKEIHC